MFRLRVFLLFFSSVVLFAGLSFGAPLQPVPGGPLAQARAELSALREENERLRTENGSLQTQLKRLQSQLKQAETRAQAAERSASRLEGELSTLRASASRPEPSAFSSGATYRNSLGMEFVRIPAGSFEMGCTSGNEGCDGDEKPRHTVTISRPFYLGKTEVTQGEWESIMGSNPSRFKGANRPIENVSWNDVQEFIERLNAKEGHTRYRLPTEAEWEYAARTGSATAYSFGDDAGRLGDYAWYWDNSGGETHPVGRKRPNAFGLHDMHGNVREWVQDWYGTYGRAAVADPVGPLAGENRVLRGGSWYDDAGSCRAAYRNRFRPFFSNDYNGFRLAFSPGH